MCKNGFSSGCTGTSEVTQEVDQINVSNQEENPQVVPTSVNKLNSESARIEYMDYFTDVSSTHSHEDCKEAPEQSSLIPLADLVEEEKKFEGPSKTPQSP